MRSKNFPQISVVMAVYNSVNFIDEAIKSILNQTFEDFELIIIDDASTDGSISAINHFAKRDKRIKVIKNKNNLGVAESRNKGLKIARGKYIAITDSDDVCKKERLEVEYRYLEKNTDVFLVGSSFEYIDQRGNKKGKKIINLPQNKLDKRILNGYELLNATIMFRNGFNYYYRRKFTLSEDYDLFLRLISDKRRISILSKNLYEYRINPSSLMHTQSNKQKLFAKKAREFYNERCYNRKDSYESFNPSTILSLKEKHISGELLVKARELKFLFKNTHNMHKYRKEIKRFWQEQGMFKWKKGIVYYIISFAPQFIISKIKRFIWK